MLRFRELLGLALLLLAGLARADVVSVAVASNFLEPLREIASAFESASGHRVSVSAGSTGKLYAQIVNGAPYDIFLSADAERPGLLEARGLARSGTRKTYAIGRLVLWSSDPAFAGDNCADVLPKIESRRLAIANPELAPYGYAAKEYLLRIGEWKILQGNMVYGENIGQALSFAATGNASVALIAASQLARASALNPTCAIPIDASLHSPILQQAVMLQKAADSAAVALFFEFLDSPPAQGIIADYGFALPGHE